ncbi:MAG: NAD(P)H-dependent oxidoreductase [Eudoraea sp.]|nr:NAD(P)H-dependent oxidoreductase [Eudoraea sp.]
MATIIAFAGSNSSTSINYQLVKYTVGLVEEHQVQLLNLANFPFPMYSEDQERKWGFSNSLVEFKDDLKNAAGLVLSVNEHNGSPSAYFKNVLDWLSRVDRKFLEDTPVLLMSASPGGRGAIGSLGIIKDLLPRFGAEVVATFSRPSFNQNFDPDKGIVEAELASLHAQALEQFLKRIS